MYYLRKARVERRMADILIDKTLLREHPELVNDIFSDKLIIRAEYFFSEEGILYTCYNLGFKKVDLGDKAPRLFLHIEWEASKNEAGEEIMVPADWSLSETP